ncbi:MFS transporter [Bacillus cereus group sp. BfR-BA-01380]|uniref:MFS transporter n=1 Tax=Bacillus cereus group sp. BfR-BA-01380 TaxID=2920324 RepID=UPI001F58421F|nr:MFS transporter [Bacillus cereus group sp. BfR-BA-01380]
MSTKNQQRKFPLALFALLISAFAIGTTEFVIMGILPDVANDLHVSLSAAGLLVTGYALGVAIGGPIITAFTGQLPRKKLLFGLMLIFIGGNLLAAISPNYSVLMFARILASFAHGTFFGVGSIVAARLVPREKQASAVAMMFAGLTLANILGVPLGTFIGQMWGWRATFWVVTFLGIVSLIGIIGLVPHIREEKSSNFYQEILVLRNKQVLLALLMTVLGFGGVFTAFTYITPILTGITGFSASSVTPILLVFGVGMTLGNTIGGKLSDWKLMPSLVGMLAFLAIILAVFTVTSSFKVATVITVFVWGFASFAIVPAFQIRVLTKAKGSPNIASAMNISSFNLANAGGAFLGGWIIDNGPGLHAVPWIAALVTVAGLFITLLSWSFDKQESTFTAQQSRKI